MISDVAGDFLVCTSAAGCQKIVFFPQ